MSEIYPDKLLIAIKWLGFIFCMVQLTAFFIHGWFAYAIYDSYLRVDGDIIDPIPRAKAV